MSYKLYSELTQKDSETLHSLCDALGVPLYPFKSDDEVFALKKRGYTFFNGTPTLVYNGGLGFSNRVKMMDLLHEVAHALFLGPALYKRLGNGITNLGDDRWKGEEEGPVMMLQVWLASCLTKYNGRTMLREMEDFGYGFGGNNTARGWWVYMKGKEAATAKRLREYKTLQVTESTDTIPYDYRVYIEGRVR